MALPMHLKPSSTECQPGFFAQELEPTALQRAPCKGALPCPKRTHSVHWIPETALYWLLKLCKTRTGRSAADPASACSGYAETADAHNLSMRNTSSCVVYRQGLRDLPRAVRNAAQPLNYIVQLPKRPQPAGSAKKLSQSEKSLLSPGLR